MCQNEEASQKSLHYFVNYVLANIDHKHHIFITVYIYTLMVLI